MKAPFIFYFIVLSASLPYEDNNADSQNEFAHKLFDRSLKAFSRDNIPGLDRTTLRKTGRLATRPSARPAKNVVVICGPSGVGKGSLVDKILSQKCSKIGFSVSHTTRNPRSGEVDGEHYHFVKKRQMQADIVAGKFIEHAEVHGNLYGTSIKAVTDVIESGKVCILDIDVQGAESVKKSELNATAAFVFISPPSLEELEKRLRGRGTENEDKIRTRMESAAGFMAYLKKDGFWTEVIVNDDFQQAYLKLKKFIQRTCKLRI